MKKILPVSVGVFFLGVTLAGAHTGHSPASGFHYGFGHPFGGWDHLLAMIAVGLWAAQLGGRALWIVPASFVATMLAGGALGIFGLQVPMLEQGIAISVLLLGLAVAFAVRLSVLFPALIVACFAIFHGAAHGAEMPGASSPFGYAAGFALATALLHLCGILAGEGLGRLGRPVMLRASGAAIALCGLVLLVG